MLAVDVLLVELARLRSIEKAVLALHRSRESTIYRHGVCTTCSTRASVQYPCPTVLAVIGGQPC